MRKLSLLCAFLLLICLFAGCEDIPCQVLTTTAPIYELTSLLCQNTEIRVSVLISENVSCLHDYTLQVSQMRMLENAELLIKNGAGLEVFLEDIAPACPVIDCSDGISLLSGDEDEHHTGYDAHFWLSPDNACKMVTTICAGLIEAYPDCEDTLQENCRKVLVQLEELKTYGKTQLSSLKSRELITFHDGFSYFAEAFDLTILKAVEEESGSEASAGELKELVWLIREHDLPSIFIEINGSTAAAEILASETGVSVCSLDMGMSELGYFKAMYHNIRTVKEALG